MPTQLPAVEASSWIRFHCGKPSDLSHPKSLSSGEPPWILLVACPLLIAWHALVAGNYVPVACPMCPMPMMAREPEQGMEASWHQ